MGARYISRSSFQPGCSQWAKCTFGSATDMSATDQEGQVVLGTGLTSDLNTTGAFPVFYIPFGTMVRDVVVRKITAFDSTGAFTMNIGDTDVDGYWPSTDLVASDAGNKGLKSFVSTAEGGSYPAYVTARFYDSTGDTYDTDLMFAINVTVGTAKVSAGKAEIYIEYMFLPEVKLP